MKRNLGSTAFRHVRACLSAVENDLGTGKSCWGRKRETAAGRTSSSGGVRMLSRAQMEESLLRMMAGPVGPARRLEPVREGVEEAFWLLLLSQWNGKQGQPPAVRKGEEALEVWDRRCSIILWDSSRVIKLGKHRFLDTPEASLQFKFMNQKQNQTTWSYVFLQHFQLNMCRYDTDRPIIGFRLSWVFERLWS